MHPPGYTVRPATNRDVPLIWDHISGILRSYGITTDIHTTDRDLADIEATYGCGTFLTVWQGAQLVGTGAYRMVDLTHAEIGRMYILPEHRGKGLGISMLKTLTAAAASRGACVLSLKTASVLKDAVQLYTRFGFVIQDTVTCGNCNVTMAKTISDLTS